MSSAHYIGQGSEIENRRLRKATVNARKFIRDALKTLVVTLGDEPIMVETPLEMQAAVNRSIEAMRDALRSLENVEQEGGPYAPKLPDAPTRQQGQVIAFIREYMMRNEAGVAPTHAALQRFFNLTAPSVNSMLIRLERRGFIRRIPGKARAIELMINHDLIPQLAKPFKF